MLGATSEQVHACPAYAQEISQHTTQKQGSQHTGEDVNDVQVMTYLPRVSNQRPPPALLGQRSSQAIAHLLRTLCSVSETSCLCGRSCGSTQRAIQLSTSQRWRGSQADRADASSCAAGRQAVHAVQQASAVRSNSAKACESCARCSSN